MGGSDFQIFLSMGLHDLFHKSRSEQWDVRAGLFFFFNNGMLDYWAIGCFPMGIFQVIERSEQWSVGEMTWGRCDSLTTVPLTAYQKRALIDSVGTEKPSIKYSQTLYSSD